MNKEKLKYIPINLFLSLPTFFVTLIVLSFIPKLDMGLDVIISLSFYMLDAKQGSLNDYYEEKFKKIEKELKDRGK